MTPRNVRIIDESTNDSGHLKQATITKLAFLLSNIFTVYENAWTWESPDKDPVTIKPNIEFKNNLWTYVCSDPNIYAGQKTKTLKKTNLI